MLAPEFKTKTPTQPEFRSILERLTEKVARANSIQHSGGKVTSEDWSELYNLVNESRAILRSAS